jgi:hypothetical protein
MTIGLTWRRTARRIKRLKEGVLTISPDYSDRPTPDFLALSWFFVILPCLADSICVAPVLSPLSQPGP